MSYNYVVTAQKPTAVNACITGKPSVCVRVCAVCHLRANCSSRAAAAAAAGQTAPDWGLLLCPLAFVLLKSNVYLLRQRLYVLLTVYTSLMCVCF